MTAVLMAALLPTEAKQATQFKPGNEGGPGRGKTVNTDSCSPITNEPKRDAKEMHARSTVGQIAAARAATQFKPGVSPNPGGKPKAEAHPKSGEPEKPRDAKAEHANSRAA